MTSMDRIRNVVLVGHQGGGKTSLAEALLFRAGAITRLGSVEKGSTRLDFDAESRARGQTVSLAVTAFEWRGHRVNLIDTPGYADFVGDAAMGMQVADLAVFVIDGVAGVQGQDRVLWRRAERLGLPRLVFINKLDRDRASFERTLEQVREVFGSHADPVDLPIGEQSSFAGITDLIAHRSFVGDEEQAEHDHLVEEVIELDDSLLERYLEGEEPTPADLDRLLHRAVDDGSIFPVLCGSAVQPAGVELLADFVCRVGPAPGDAGPIEALAGDVGIELAPDPEGQPLVFVFKTTFDDFLGQVSLVKVLSGRISVDDSLTNTRTRATERLHQLATLDGPDHAWVAEASAGDIIAVPKLAHTLTGDTLAPTGLPVAVLPLPLPAPTYRTALSATKPSEEDKLLTLLRRLAVEDPTLLLHHDERTGQTLLGGYGEMHLQVALAKLARQGVDVALDDVRVPYLETLAGPAEVEGRHKKQSGGHGQFGVARVRFEPLSVGGGFEYVSEVRGGAIPTALVPAVGAGIAEAMAQGGLHGHPLVDVRAVCIDGKHHPVDSSELAFKLAGAAALREAIDQVGVVVLEPVSDVWVTVPTDEQGVVLGDLNARRARILGTATDTADAGVTVVHAQVPDAEITRYAVDLRSMTGGLGSFEVAPAGYQVLDDAFSTADRRPVS